MLFKNYFVYFDLSADRKSYFDDKIEAPAILRPCTPLYAHVRPVRPQITPSTPIAPMGVHGRTLYAHKKFVRPHNCTPMGVHGRTCTPTKKSQHFFVGVQCRPMYTHVRPWAYICMGVQIFYGRTMYAHVLSIKIGKFSLEL